MNILKTVTGVRVYYLLEELGKRTPAAYVLVIFGFLSFLCVGYVKYLQMQTPQTKSPEEQPLNINDNENDIKKEPTPTFQKLYWIVHLLVAGPVYTFADIALQATVVYVLLKKYLDHTLILEPLNITINTACVITLVIQDTRLVVKTLRYNPEVLSGITNFFGTFEKSKLGQIIEAIAVLYRTAASKISLFLLIVAQDSLLGYTAFQIYNPLSFYCKWTNNQTYISEPGPLSNRQKIFATIQAFVFCVSYCIEDAALFINALADICKLNAKVVAVLFCILIVLEVISYWKKCYKTSKKLTKVYSEIPQKLCDLLRKKKKMKAL